MSTVLTGGPVEKPAPADPPPARPAGGAGLSTRTIALVVGAVFYLGSFFVFRYVLLAIPSVLNGDAVIAGDELVPFFNPSSQLFEQAEGQFNELVNGYEFRVRYAFLTTWLRYYKVLPFAILLVIPSLFWVAYLTVARFMDKVFTTLSSQAIYLAAAFPVTLIYLIMSYSKITHFYTLILGLVLMTVSALWMLYALLFAGRKWKRYMVLSSVATLLNPAIHYLILFSLFFGITIVTLLIGEIGRWIRRGGPVRALLIPGRAWRLIVEPGRWRKTRTTAAHVAGTTLGRATLAFLLYLVITLIPYALFVKYVALAGVTNLSDTVPGDFYFIQDASVSWLHLLSWDLAGITDKILFGDYLAKVPRYPDALYTLLLFAPLVVPPMRRRLFPNRSHRQLLGVIYVAIAFALWATIGYAQPLWFPTFHRTLANIAIAANASHSIDWQSHRDRGRHGGASVAIPASLPADPVHAGTAGHGADAGLPDRPGQWRLGAHARRVRWFQAAAASLEILRPLDTTRGQSPLSAPVESPPTELAAVAHNRAARVPNRTHAPATCHHVHCLGVFHAVLGQRPLSKGVRLREHGGVSCAIPIGRPQGTQAGAQRAARGQDGGHSADRDC